MFLTRLDTQFTIVC